MILALHYLSMMEIIFRLIVNNLFRDSKKFDLRHPYTVMNNCNFKKISDTLLVLEKNKIRTKADIDVFKNKDELIDINDVTEIIQPYIENKKPDLLNEHSSPIF